MIKKIAIAFALGLVFGISIAHAGTKLIRKPGPAAEPLEYAPVNEASLHGIVSVEGTRDRGSAYLRMFNACDEGPYKIISERVETENRLVKNTWDDRFSFDTMDEWTVFEFDCVPSTATK